MGRCCRLISPQIGHLPHIEHLLSREEDCTGTGTTSKLVQGRTPDVIGDRRYLARAACWCESCSPGTHSC